MSYETFTEGQIIRHKIRKTITEGEHILYCSITMNPQPLHIDFETAKQSIFGKPLVNGLFTLSLVVGITVHELTFFNLVANLGYNSITHPHPVFHGDTLHVVTEVMSKRESQSRPGQGIVEFKHLGYNQHDEVVIEVQRAALFKITEEDAS